MAATLRAPWLALPAADSSRSRARSSSIPSAAATRCRRAEAASRDLPRPGAAPGAGWSEVGVQRRPVQRVGEPRAYSPTGHHATSPSPATPPTPRLDGRPGRSAGHRQGHRLAHDGQCRRGFPGIWRRLGQLGQDHRRQGPGTKSSPPGAASCEKKARPGRHGHTTQAAAVLMQPPDRPPGKAIPPTPAISPTSSCSERPARPASNQTDPKTGSDPSGAAPERLVTGTSTGSSPTRRTTSAAPGGTHDPPSPSPLPPPPRTPPPASVSGAQGPVRA